VHSELVLEVTSARVLKALQGEVRIAQLASCALAHDARRDAVGFAEVSARLGGRVGQRRGISL
jgi:hypothetical protein